MSRCPIALACAAFIIAPVAMLPGAAMAQTGQRLQPVTGTPVTDSGGWVVTLRANAIGGPKFPGASDLGFVAFPSGSIRRAGSPVRFAAPDDGPSLALYDSGTFRAGLTARYQSGRYTADDRRLAGIRDAKWAIEPGAFVDIWAVPETLRARFEIRRGFHGHEGVVGNFGLDLVQRFGQWTVSLGPRVYVADAEYMKSYFGVSARDASWNQRVSAYKPDGGLKGYGVAGGVTYQINEAWAVTGHARYERLAKQAADSPIVKQFGSRDQISFGATLSYSFIWR